MASDVDGRTVLVVHGLDANCVQPLMYDECVGLEVDDRGFHGHEARVGLVGGQIELDLVRDRPNVGGKSRVEPGLFDTRLRKRQFNALRDPWGRDGNVE